MTKWGQEAVGKSVQGEILVPHLQVVQLVTYVIIVNNLEWQ